MGGGVYGGGGVGAEIDISQAPESGDDGGKYMSGGITIQVTKIQVNQDTGGENSTEWVCYKHSSTSGFILKKITHSDQTMQSTDGNPPLSDNMNMTINAQGAVYVYYSDSGTKLHEPKVICISENGPEDSTKNKWYTAGSNQIIWVFQSNGINGNKTINAVTEAELAGAQAGDIIIPQSNDYIIKLDKRPLAAGLSNKIKYRTKNKEISVERKEGPTDEVPQGYIAYEHQVDIPGKNTIILQHNGNMLKEVEVTETQNVSKIFVYYEGNNDSEHQFPLIVCVKMNNSSQTYYKRGQRWEVENSLSQVNPDDAQTAGNSEGDLANKLSPLVDKYEIKLEKNGNYKGSPQSTGNDITVAPEDVSNFKGYHHSHASGMTINRITHYGIPIRGIPELDSNNTITIAANNKVWVFYEAKDTNRNTPLLLYFRKGTSSGATNHWYGRGKKWEKHSDMSTVDISSSIGTNEKATIASKLNVILEDRVKI